MDTAQSYGVHEWCVLYPDRIDGYGTGTVVAANGDSLFFDFLVSYENFQPPEYLEMNILGGSGRFEDAQGSFTTTSELLGPGLSHFTIVEGCMTHPGW